jgi:hypothetical protein
MLQGIPVPETAGPDRQYHIRKFPLNYRVFNAKKRPITVLPLCGFLWFRSFDGDYFAAVIGTAGFTNMVRQFRAVALRTFDCGGSFKS